MSERTPTADRPSQVLALAPLVRGVIARRVADQPTAEDLAQETLARLLVVADRLDPGALAPYAVVTARNLSHGLARSRDRALRHSHRLVDLRPPEDPEERALQEEDRRTLDDALGLLPAMDRQALIAHDVEGVETAVLADHLGTTPGAMAVRLSRARARLRVEYLLALRRVEPPSPSCRPVLLAISTGDKRRQRALRIGEHLLACPPCAALSEPLVRRRRPLGALWPVLGLDQLVRWLRRNAREHPAPAAITSVAAAGVAVWVVAASFGAPPPSEGVVSVAPPPPTLFVLAEPPIPFSGDDPMGAYVGMVVEARGALVQSEIDRSGFWVGDPGTGRVWVDVHDETVPPNQLTRDTRVDFQATLSPNTQETLEAASRGGALDRAQLEGQGHHLDVRGETIRVAAD